MIALFAGHIGKDSGAVGQTDNGKYYNESAVTLSITHKVSSILNNIGIDNEIFTGSLRERIENSKHCTLGISIHADASTNHSVSGAHLIYYPNSIKGLSLANSITETLTLLNVKVARRSHERSNLYILHKTVFPCALIETGFLTNTKDYERLYSVKGQWKLAYSIAYGVILYEKNNIN